MQRKENQKMSIVYHSAPNKQYFNNIHDAIPLDTSSNINVPALPYITWRLIWDPKIESEIPKIGKKESLSLPKSKMGYILEVEIIGRLSKL